MVQKVWILIFTVLVVVAVFIGFTKNNLANLSIDTPNQISVLVENEASAELDEVKTDAAAPIGVADQEDPSHRTFFKQIDPSLVDGSLIEKWVAVPGVTRYRVVEVNTNELRAHMRGTEREKDLYLDLFDDLTVVGVPKSASEYHEGPRAGIGRWVGSVDGYPKSLLSVHIGSDGETSIHISGAFGAFNVVRVTDTAYHLIIEHSTNRRHEPKHEHYVLDDKD